MPQKVGFMGLGHMGKPMAENLVRKGFDLTVYDLREEPLEALKKMGAKVARSSKEVGQLCDIIITMVVDTKQAETVILGEQGALAGARPGSLIVIMCTVSASFCKRAAEIAAKKGVGVIDAPVTGGPTGAAAGTLSIMVGGDSRLLEKCRPVLQAMSTNIFHFGSVGQGQVVKAAKNLISVSQYIAISEAVAMVTKAGVDTERFFEMMRTSTGNCWALQGKNWYLWWMRKIAEPETTYLNVKDANLAVDVAKEFGLHLEHLESLPRINLLELLKAVPREVVISHLEEK